MEPYLGGHTTMHWRSWAKDASVVLLALLTLAMALGCAGLIFGGQPTVPHVQGEWTGVLEPVRMYDTAVPRNRYMGVALRIVSGPPNPHPIPPELGGGLRPVLIWHKEDSNLRIIPAEKVPVGKVVRVKGTMGANHAMNPTRHEVPVGDKFLKRKLYQDADIGVEHIIVVTGEIKVLADQSAATTRPAAEPVAPGPQTPLGAVLAYAMAWVDADAPGLRSMLCADTPKERELADALVRLVQAGERLEEAGNWKFHPVGMRRILHALDPRFSSWGAKLILRGLDAPDSDPQVEVDGATARIAVPQVGTVHLRQDKGQWRIVLPLGEMKGDPAKFYDLLADRYEQVARDIAADKCASPEEAAKAIKSGLILPEPGK